MQWVAARGAWVPGVIILWRVVAVLYALLNGFRETMSCNRYDTIIINHSSKLSRWLWGGPGMRHYNVRLAGRVARRNY